MAGGIGEGEVMIPMFLDYAHEGFGRDRNKI